MFGIGGPELVVILIVGLIFIGPDKLPKVAKTVGAGLRDLRRAANVAQAELKETMDDLVREADLEDVLRDRTASLDEQRGRSADDNNATLGAASDAAIIDPPARRPDPGGFHLDDEDEDDDDGALVGRSAFADDSDDKDDRDDRDDRDDGDDELHVHHDRESEDRHASRPPGGGVDDRPAATPSSAGPAAARARTGATGAAAATTLSDRLGGKLEALAAREDRLAERQEARRERARQEAEADAVPPMPDPHSLHRVPDLSGIEDTMPRRRPGAGADAGQEPAAPTAEDTPT